MAVLSFLRPRRFLPYLHLSPVAGLRGAVVGISLPSRIYLVPSIFFSQPASEAEEEFFNRSMSEDSTPIEAGVLQHMPLLVFINHDARYGISPLIKEEHEYRHLPPDKRGRDIDTFRQINAGGKGYRHRRCRQNLTWILVSRCAEFVRPISPYSLCTHASSNNRRPPKI